MNVIFLDFDGVLDTAYYQSDEMVEEKVKILSSICKKYNAYVVIEAAAKDFIDEETLECEGKWLTFLFSLFNKYDIKVIGRTPNVKKRYNDYAYSPIWKEDEIRLYLFRHPEILHYCVIDDDDLMPRNSDLNKVRDHLVTTKYYDENHENEGLLPLHEKEIGKILSKDNNVRKLILKRKNLTR